MSEFLMLLLLSNPLLQDISPLYTPLNNNSISKDCECPGYNSYEREDNSYLDNYDYGLAEGAEIIVIDNIYLEPKEINVIIDPYNDDDCGKRRQ